MLTTTKFKKCKKCQCTKPVTKEFWHTNKACVFGVKPTCKVCINLYLAVWRKQEHVRAKAGAWRQTDTHKRYQQEYHKEYQPLYAANNRERRALNERRRRHRKRTQGEQDYTSSDIQELLELQNQLCAYCAIDISQGFHIDHMLPISRGGSDTLANLTLTCPSCNISKSSRTVEEFMGMVS